MKAGFWMHKSCLDAFIEVIKVKPRDSKHVRVRARWWVLGYTGNPWCTDIYPKTISIPADDLDKWVDIGTRVTNVRTRPGVPDVI